MRPTNNRGRTDANMGKYKPVIDSLIKKLPNSQSALEKAWLLHEIGRAHLEMQNYEEAKKFGEKGLAISKKAKDNGWELNALLLLSQAKGILMEINQTCIYLYSFSIIKSKIV